MRRALSRRTLFHDSSPTMTDPLSARGPALTDPESCNRFIERVFGGDRGKFDTFVETVRSAITPEVAVIVRGSSVTGHRAKGGQPFDADGPGTSDVDLTFVGGDMVKLYDSFHIPAIHSVPMGEDHPDAAPALKPLREKLCELAGRPVNIQATTDFVQYVRDVTMNQPYLVLIERQDGQSFEGGAPAADTPRASLPELDSLPLLGPP